jgi:hypothetical protein
MEFYLLSKCMVGVQVIRSFDKKYPNRNIFAHHIPVPDPLHPEIPRRFTRDMMAQG